MTVYILQAQGIGDLEDAFYNVGVYSTHELAQNAEQNFVRDFVSEEGFEIATNIEMLEMDM
jgi:predicted N-acyltransferase